MPALADNRFTFKKFEIIQNDCSMKVGTDGVLLGAWSTCNQASRALDIGSGTGLIALMLTQRNPHLEVDAIEINEESSEESRLNFSNSPWSNRLTVENVSLQEFAKDSTNLKRYDLIVSNPPFFSGGTISKQLSRSEARHTAKLSHTDLLHNVQKLLIPRKGRFALILPYMDGLRFKELALTYGLYLSKCTDVRPKTAKNVERLLMEFCYLKSDVKCEYSELILQKEGHQEWTEEYLELTKDFYLFA